MERKHLLLQTCRIEEVSTEKSCEDFLNQILSSETNKIVGFDIEFYEKKNGSRAPSTIQISTCHLTIIIRLTQINPKKCPTLYEFLSDRSILKIGVGVINDAEYLERYHKMKMAGCVDLRNLLNKTCLKQTSSRKLETLTKYYLGLTLAPSPAEWENQTLSEAQLIYAASDSFFSLQLFYQFWNSIAPAHQRHSVVCCPLYESILTETKYNCPIELPYDFWRGGKIMSIVQSYAPEEITLVIKSQHCDEHKFHLSPAFEWGNKAVGVVPKSKEKQLKTKPAKQKFANLIRMFRGLGSNLSSWTTLQLEEYESITQQLLLAKLAETGIYEGLLEEIMRLCVHWRWNNKEVRLCLMYENILEKIKKVEIALAAHKKLSKAERAEKARLFRLQLLTDQTESIQAI